MTDEQFVRFAYWLGWATGMLGGLMIGNSIWGLAQ